MPHIHELIDFTASAFIMHPSQPKLLLLLHRKLGRWFQPGGHIELHENPLQTLHHELEEETGLRPKDYTLLEPAEQPRPGGTNITLPLPFYFNIHPMSNLPTHQHIDICYLARAKTDKLTTEPDGADAIGWFDRGQIRKLRQQDKMLEEIANICEWIFERKF